MSSNILLLYPPNNKSVAIETLIDEILKLKFNVIVITLTEKGEFHRYLDKAGVENYCFVQKKKSRFAYVHNLYKLVNFCYKHKIDVVWSHLQQANVLAVIAQYFIKARVVLFRHHFHASIKIDGLKSVNRNERILEKIICSLAKEIVVPSREVYDGMVKYENIPSQKLSIIPYLYNFSRYSSPNDAEVLRIKETYKSRLLIVTASRMVKMKRHMLVLPIYKKLIQEGLDIKVLLLDNGDQRELLEEYVNINQLNNSVFFLGFKKNVIDYVAAADLLVHPSFTEASSSLVKEFGYLGKPVIVCEGVGDFSDYIKTYENGLLVSAYGEDQQFEKYIRYIYNNPDIARSMGENLHHTVTKCFSPNPETINNYLTKI